MEIEDLAELHTLVRHLPKEQGKRLVRKMKKGNVKRIIDQVNGQPFYRAGQNTYWLEQTAFVDDGGDVTGWRAGEQVEEP